MSAVVNRKPLEHAIWEWTPDMQDWLSVECRLEFDLVNVDVVDEPMRAWLKDDGFSGECFILPSMPQDIEQGWVVVAVLFENHEAAFNFKIRWG
jgi:hypothetical protein